jgi:hypothetical protein
LTNREVAVNQLLFRSIGSLLILAADTGGIGDGRQIGGLLGQKTCLTSILVT